ncbi:DEAD-box ATP-dependent RNA helicase FANCM isoform X2 [Aristolochia californica]|uniref:DEAD-box ATP-dependent RNA helicase FANCM isoform X2 n=1 Tax=Aristolochia californica TaxID=171875 RepID=UPI0035D88223
MPTSGPLDDDEFDWDAAVREIDVACGGIALNSNQVEPSGVIPGNATKTDVVCPKTKNGVGGRQTTLDKFIGSKALREKFHSNESNACKGDANLEPNDGPYAKIDLEAAKTWIYPVNVPLRDYQFNIAKTALFSNTLVALPTGLGKTLIAAVVMYNFFRWFPEGKIVFAAPSRPLVLQQIEACHNIVGIPQEWTMDMTGQMSPSKRSKFWIVKRVFFVTPQVLEKDIQAGTCLMRQLVLLVIDEAHRAMGNYAYCVAVRELMAVPVHLRILALTATPGSKQSTIQNVIDNLYISTLEYRNEDDHDVSPYVHNRKLELMEVPMGNDAVKISIMLLEIVQPFASRLCALGVLGKRDYATLSPCELLNSRDKFRQAPPMSLPHAKHGEIEAYFGVLITLYHIRKLLSSHGIRPAYEMLEEKMQQGSFARVMARNERIWKAKLLMQQSLSHGAPNPKLLKMIDVLLDHFKTNDPKDSRVIIFSNFRGSVKDIMDSLANIGELVKATQFIGQSSGKTLKGQSQKMQQEVLQKFRSGGYNVIVATSIGEEGLDIMEVDLVICFDANISPLRMIQRMGRTGRKHDGRVVVLACEGSEMKGYLRKQANSKAVRKHMHNGGTNSFNFHLSPRMVPHVCKPEVQIVELSIEQFVPRGKKMKDDFSSTPALVKKISEVEADTISKYFGHSQEEDIWRPSLIAFPHFQAFPSKVHSVRHSHRTTGMLIDTMERLQGLSSCQANLHVNTSSDQCLQVIIRAPVDGNEGDARSGVVEAFSPSKMEFKEPSTPSSKDDNEPFIPDISNHNLPFHCFLFGTNFVSVEPYGRVLISSVPNLPTRDTHDHRCIAANSLILTSHVSNSGPPAEKVLHTDEKTAYQVLVSDWVPTKMKLTFPDSPVDVEMEAKDPAEHEPIRDLEDLELSPRLTNFIEKGVVPESPIVQCQEGNEGSGDLSHSLLDSHVVKNLNFEMNEKVEVGKNWHEKIIENDGYLESPVVKEAIPLVHNTIDSSGENWRMSSGEASTSVKQEQKFKRLRKYGEIMKRLPCKVLNEEFCTVRSKLGRSLTRTSFGLNVPVKEMQKAKVDIKDFIEEEAEVSADAEVSGDEQEDKPEDQEDSFIDDRVDPSAVNGAAEVEEVDMMAIYRRSLLTQSPVECLASTSDSQKAAECGSCSSEGTNKCPTPTASYSTKIPSARNSVSYQVNVMRASSLASVGETRGSPCEEESKIRKRKRKLFVELGSVHASTCREEHLIQSEGTGEAPLHLQRETELTHNEFFDDQFYEGLDLDAVEEQASKILRSKVSVTEKRGESSTFSLETEEAVGQIRVGSPSFDLGI